MAATAMLSIVLAVLFFSYASADTCSPPVGTIYDLVPDPYLTKPPDVLPSTAPDIPIDFNKQTGTYLPEQIALFPATRDVSYVFVQWVIDNKIANKESFVRYGQNTKELKSQISRVAPHNYTYALGTEGEYISGQIYTAIIGPLAPSTQYIYQIEGSSTIYSFTSLPRPGPVKFNLGLIADVGQTYNSSVTMDHVASSPNDFVLFIGDLTYADNYEVPCTAYNGTDLGYGTCGMGGLRWDSFARLYQKVSSQKLTYFVPGNHEIENEQLWGEVEPFQAYSARVPALIDNSFPYGQFAKYVNRSLLPNGGFPAKPPIFHSLDLGPVHAIGISSFSGFTIYTHQYNWLRDDLCSIDRSVTPWVVVYLHQPWYNTDKSHYREGEPMRYLYEPYFYNATVDLVFGGHVHAYERSFPVYNYRLDSCGSTHITVGDGGNDEGIAGPFLTPQPYYSAYREYSFGHANVEFTSATEATYTWYRNQNSSKVAGDIYQLTNLYSKCGPKKPKFCK